MRSYENVCISLPRFMFSCTALIYFIPFFPTDLVSRRLYFEYKYFSECRFPITTGNKYSWVANESVSTLSTRLLWRQWNEDFKMFFRENIESPASDIIDNLVLRSTDLLRVKLHANVKSDRMHIQSTVAILALCYPQVHRRWIVEPLHWVSMCVRWYAYWTIT